MIQGIKSFEEKVMRSKMDPDHPGFQPLYQKAGWRRNEMARDKALKRGNWFKGGKEKEEWRNLTKTSSRRMNRKKFQKAGDKKGQVAIVVFVPSTKSGLLVRKLREREEEMAALTGFKIKYQEAGGKKLINSFEKDLGERKTLWQNSMSTL